ncbi:MAG: type II CAAX endopeptidase family protein [Actinomycetota bacterium]
MNDSPSPGRTPSLSPEFHPEAPERKPLGAGKATLVFVLWVFTGVVVAGVTFALYEAIQGDAQGAIEDPRSGLPHVSAAVGAIAGGAVLLALTRAFVPAPTMKAALARVGFVKVRARALGAAAFVGVVIALITVGVQVLFPPGEGFEDPLSQMASVPGWPRILFVFVVIVVAPLEEELLFRGVMYTGFVRSTGKWVAAVLVTVLFAAGHYYGYWPATAMVLVVGAAMLAVRVKTGSLWPAVALHFSYNLLYMVAFYLFPGL